MKTKNDTLYPYILLIFFIFFIYLTSEALGNGMEGSNIIHNGYEKLLYENKYWIQHPTVAPEENDTQAETDAKALKRLKAVAKWFYWSKNERHRYSTLEKIYFDITQDVEDTTLYMNKVVEGYDKIIQGYSITSAYLAKDYLSVAKESLKEAISRNCANFINHLPLELTEESRSEITNALTDLTNTILFDVVGEKDPKKQLEALKGLLFKYELKAGYNMGAWLAMVKSEQTYASKVLSTKVLDEYYRCGASFQVMEIANNLGATFNKYKKYQLDRTYEEWVILAYTMKIEEEDPDIHFQNMIDEDYDRVFATINFIENYIDSFFDAYQEDTSIFYLIDVTPEKNFYNEIMNLVKLGAIDGTKEKFNITENVTQYEFLKMAAYVFYNEEYKKFAMNEVSNSGISYTDEELKYIKQKTYFMFFEGKKILRDTETINILNKDVKILRGQVAEIIYRIIDDNFDPDKEINLSLEVDFRGDFYAKYDIGDGEKYITYKVNVADWNTISGLLDATGIAHGYENSLKFGEDEKISRGESVKILYNTYKKVIKK